DVDARHAVGAVQHRELCRSFTDRESRLLRLGDRVAHGASSRSVIGPGSVRVAPGGGVPRTVRRGLMARGRASTAYLAVGRSADTANAFARSMEESDEHAPSRVPQTRCRRVDALVGRGQREAYVLGEVRPVEVAGAGEDPQVGEPSEALPRVAALGRPQ